MGLFSSLFKPRESAAQRSEWIDGTMRSVAAQVQGRIAQDMRAAKRSFEAAETTPWTESWDSFSNHINLDLERQLSALWGRSAGLARNNEWAQRYLIELDDNVLGHNGMQLQMRLTRNARGPNGMEAVPDDKQNAALEQVWREWGEADADVSGLSWSEVESLALSTLARRGELLYRLCPGSGPMKFQIQILDPMLLDVTLHRDTGMGGNRIRMGKEIDDNGKPVAYWLQLAKTGDIPSGYITQGRHVRIPASEIRHHYIVEEPGQLRGIPWLTVGARRLWLLKDFEESAAVASSNAAKRQGFFVSPDGNAPPGFTDTIVSSVLDAAKAAGKVLTPDEIQAITAAAEKYSTTVPGQYDTLPQGYDFRSYDSAWPNINAETYVKQQVRGWAAARGMSYVSLGNDLEAVNYSSAQVGILGEREHHKKVQSRLRKWLHEEVFEAALPYLVLSSPALQTSRLDDYEDAATWICKRWAPIDPFKAAKAAEVNLGLRLTSRRRMIIERGDDPDEVFAEIAQEEEMFGPIQIAAADPNVPADPGADPNADPNADPEADTQNKSRSRHLHLAATRGLTDGA